MGAGRQIPPLPQLSREINLREFNTFSQRTLSELSYSGYLLAHIPIVDFLTFLSHFLILLMFAGNHFLNK
jgi:hypothetical protein